MITITRFHDFSAGHRVHGHESKCAHLHGHNYRVYFTCTADELDKVGRVMDFSAVKRILCEWLEENWDHKFLLWDQDTDSLFGRSFEMGRWPTSMVDELGVVRVPFNPTAENMANYLLILGNVFLRSTGVRVIQVTVWETRKCSATATLSEGEKKCTGKT